MASEENPNAHKEKNELRILRSADPTYEVPNFELPSSAYMEDYEIRELELQELVNEFEIEDGAELRSSK